MVPFASGTVLVVDDEPGVRRVCAAALESMGLQVVLAEDADEALAIALGGEARLDAVLLDLTMPGLSGEEALRALRRERPGLPVLTMSGFLPAGLDLREDDRFTGFLQKPFTVAQLSARLHALMDAVLD